MKRLLTIGLLITSAHAQVYLANNADMAVHPGDTVSIFGDVTNLGRFGSLNGSVVQFYGTTWQNAPGGILPGEAFYGLDTTNGQGGYFRFLHGIGTQTLQGGSFPSLGAGNDLGVYLGGDARIRDTLRLENGLLYLNGYNLTLGNGAPGRIDGYDNQRYIATDSAGTFSRQAITQSDGMVVFPIGTAHYAPLAVQSHTPIAVTYHATVYDGPATDTSVGKTWRLGAGALNVSDVTVWLQHDIADEGPLFPEARDSSFISLDGDTLGPRGALNPGTLTTGPPDINAWLNARDFTGAVLANAYLRVVDRPPSMATLDFEAFRRTIHQVHTFWSTVIEHDVQRYELQRRRLEEDSFYTVAVVPPHFPGGSSDTPQRYDQEDDNFYGKITYYRLKIYGNDGRIAYSQTRVVPAATAIQVSPNPSYGTFTVAVFGQNQPIGMAMYDMRGRQVGVYAINGSATINATALAAGTYVLVFYDGHTRLDTQRIILLRH
ncbi:MAG TPA: T9SS type A sorting domain-containing protein [Dinghuibacter sp.]|uniref:T9SS type A sorting domain-containing protein n=1 Tax=Dinghuibacter sp. TaxID=2024697 RepID=UPI002C999AD1|nr:T9SS type A sorting domain-containing protein [Dinghuibacter sp.]HTJ10778.1 T9SS type A sorting domain-containing protein [Dinghuibacter sp.]